MYEKIYFSNGFKKGYESGVNAPIRKLQCGKDDGLKFVDEVKKKFGKKSHWARLVGMSGTTIIPPMR